MQGPGHDHFPEAGDGELVDENLHKSIRKTRAIYVPRKKKTSNSNTYVLHYPLRPINRWAVGSAYRAMDVIKRGEEMLKHFRSGSLFHYPSID